MEGGRDKSCDYVRRSLEDHRQEVTEGLGEMGGLEGKLLDADGECGTGEGNGKEHPESMSLRLTCSRNIALKCSTSVLQL